MEKPRLTPGQITDEGIADLERRLGAYYQSGPYRLVITADDIRNNAEANGDINPLFSDAGYAAKSRYRSIIAPPTYVDLIKHYTATMIGGLPGVHAFHVGNAVEFFAPVRPGDVIGPSFRPWKMSEKQGKFAGRMIAVDCEILYRNQRDELVAIAHGEIFRVVREQARQRGKYAEQKKEPYTREQIEEIWRIAESEEVRGRETRYFEDVNVGDTLGPIVRGPLRVVEISFRNWTGGGKLTGAGGMVYGGHFFQFEEYLRRPGLAEKEEGTGLMDHPHRGHWEEAFARKIGVPGIYDIAVQRTAWMTTLMTNWCGDDGWVRSVNSQFRKFNVEGDTTFITGTVTGKRVERNLHIVDIEIRCMNQRDELQTPGSGTVILPARAPGAVVPG
jgi:acyl dehydratase